CPFFAFLNEPAKQIEGIRWGLTGADESVNGRPAEATDRIAFELKTYALSGRIVVFADIRFLFRLIENGEFEATETPSQTLISPVPDGDRVERHLATEIEFPPRPTLVFLAMRLATRIEAAVFIAIDRSIGRAIV